MSVEVFTLKIMVGVLLERYSMIREFFYNSNMGMIVFLNHGMITEFSTNSNMGMIVFLKPRHDPGVSHNSNMGMIVLQFFVGMFSLRTSMTTMRASLSVDSCFRSMSLTK